MCPFFSFQNMYGNVQKYHARPFPALLNPSGWNWGWWFWVNERAGVALPHSYFTTTTITSIYKNTSFTTKCGLIICQNYTLDFKLSTSFWCWILLCSFMQAVYSKPVALVICRSGGHQKMHSTRLAKMILCKGKQIISVPMSSWLLNRKACFLYQGKWVTGHIFRRSREEILKERMGHTIKIFVYKITRKKWHRRQ